MYFEQAIHTRWAEDPALAAALSPDRVHTGLSPADDLPYATLARRAFRPRVRTNAGDAVCEARLQLDVWHDDAEAGAAVIEQALRTLNRAALPLDDGRQSARLTCGDRSAVEHDDGVWQFGLAIHAQIITQSEETL